MCLIISFRFSVLAHYSTCPCWCPYYVAITTALKYNWNSKVWVFLLSSLSRVFHLVCLLPFRSHNRIWMLGSAFKLLERKRLLSFKRACAVVCRSSSGVLPFNIESFSAWTHCSLLLRLLSSLLTMANNYSMCKSSSSFVKFIPILLFSIWF